MLKQTTKGLILRWKMRFQIGLLNVSREREEIVVIGCQESRGTASLDLGVLDGDQNRTQGLRQMTLIQRGALGEVALEAKNHLAREEGEHAGQVKVRG
jgi:hypothetical protein